MQDWTQKGKNIICTESIEPTHYDKIVLNDVAHTVCRF